jgi:hypothetical protein
LPERVADIASPAPRAAVPVGVAGCSDTICSKWGVVRGLHSDVVVGSIN